MKQYEFKDSGHGVSQRLAHLLVELREQAFLSVALLRSDPRTVVHGSAPGIRNGLRFFGSETYGLNGSAVIVEYWAPVPAGVFPPFSPFDPTYSHLDRLRITVIPPNVGVQRAIESVAGRYSLGTRPYRS